MKKPLTARQAFIKYYQACLSESPKRWWLEKQWRILLKKEFYISPSFYEHTA